MGKKDKSVKTDDTTASVSDEEEYQDEMDEETDKSKPKKKDMDNIKDAVNLAVKDMVSTNIAEALKPFMTQLQELQKTNEILAKTSDMYKKEVEEKNAKEASDLKELLQKEPYGFAKDFLEAQTLEQLRDKKTTIEGTKLYRDFIADQKKQPTPSPKAFDTPEFQAQMNDFQENVFKPMFSQWDFMHKPKGGNA